jgi:hypothetical protein
MGTEHPRHAWVPYVAGLAGGALLLKAALIIASGNQVDPRPMAVLYLTGLACGLVAAIGAGLRRRHVLSKIALALGLTTLLGAWIIGLSDAVEPLIAVVSEAAHVVDEVPVGAAGLVILLAAWFGFTRDQRTSARVATADRE